MGMLNKAKSAAPAQAEEPVEKEEPVAEEAAEPAPHAEPDADDQGGAPDNDEDDEGGDGPAMPPALEPEYKRCVDALYKVLYGDDTTSRNVLDSLDPDPKGKIESVARTSMLIMHQLDEKLNMQGDVIPYMLLTVVDRLIELLERAKKVAFSDDEIMATVAAAFEGAKNLIPNEQTANPTPEGAAPDVAPGSVPPGAAEPAEEPAEAPEASPTAEEVA